MFIFCYCLINFGIVFDSFQKIRYSLLLFFTNVIWVSHLCFNDILKNQIIVITYWFNKKKFTFGKLLLYFMLYHFSPFSRCVSAIINCNMTILVFQIINQVIQRQTSHLFSWIGCLLIVWVKKIGFAICATVIPSVITNVENLGIQPNPK